jgi:hypothetical protein
MTTTHHPDCTTLPKLKKLAARTVLAGGLGMAVMGLPAAMANADPAPPNTSSPTQPPLTGHLDPPQHQGIQDPYPPPR